MILTYHTSCAVVSFFLLRRNFFVVAQVGFLVVAGKVLGATSLPTIPVVPLCQFLVAAGNSFWLLSF